MVTYIASVIWLSALFQDGVFHAGTEHGRHSDTEIQGTASAVCRVYE